VKGRFGLFAYSRKALEDKERERIYDHERKKAKRHCVLSSCYAVGWL